MIDLGIVHPGKTIRIPFTSFDKDDGSAITMTNYAVGDILIYKDGNTAERASTSGFTATTDFDSKTGKHIAVIDLADNSTAGHFAAGSEYLVAIDQVTIDGVTTGGWIARFEIGYPEAILNTTIASLSSQTSFTLTNGPAEDDALNGRWAVIHDVASAVQKAVVVIIDYVGSTKTVTLASGATFTVATSDNVSVMGPMCLQPTAHALQSASRTIGVDSSGRIDLGLWLGSAPNALQSGRLDSYVGAMGSNVMTAAAAAADFGAELQALITGGAYALSTDANGRVRIVDGTAAGELDTTSGLVTLTASALASINAQVDIALADYDALVPADLPIAVNVTQVEATDATDYFGSLVSAVASGVWGAGTRTLTSGANIALAKGTGVTGFNDIAAADVWAVTTRLLSAGTNIVLAKGVGVTGFNDLDAAGVQSAVGLASGNLDTQLSAINALVSASAIRSALGLASANLDNQLDALPTANEVRNAVTGGAYPLDTDAFGRMRIVDGTAAGELDTTSGLVKIAGTIQTLDALNTAQVAEHDATQAAVAALNNISLSDVLSTQLTEGYAANGVLPTLTQAVLAIHQKLMAHEYEGTTSRVYKFNNTDVAFEGELDDADNPTSDRRAA